jgi:ABC-type nickel/cobalt efflux system permease component RcnA
MSDRVSSFVRSMAKRVRSPRPSSRRAAMLALALVAVMPTIGRCDTVASLLGNFTINQYCGVALTRDAIDVHYVVVFGQLPALSELHRADTDGNGVTTQAERDAHVATLVPTFANGLALRIDGVRVPLRATHWSSSLPSEQGGFSLRIDVDFATPLPAATTPGVRTLRLDNENYPNRMGWHEIVVEPAPGVAAFATDAFSTSLTDGLKSAIAALPAGGPLDERSVHLQFLDGPAPRDAELIKPRPADGTVVGVSSTSPPAADSGAAGTGSAATAPRPGMNVMLGGTTWIERQTRRLVDSISAPVLAPRVSLIVLLAAVVLGAVHALSPGHGKTIVGAYLIGSRGTPRHALFLGLTVTITHTIGVFVLGFATLYASRFIVPERLFPLLSLVSAALVLTMGLTLLAQRGRAARTLLVEHKTPRVFHAVEPRAFGAGHGVFANRGQFVMPFADGTWHSHGGGPAHSHLPPGAAGERITWRSLLTLGISGGLVPCPSALVLLLAAVALNKTAFGMVLVLAFSIGLALTLSAVGLAFLYARNRFGAVRSGGRWALMLPVISALFITGVGAVLCVGALRSFSVAG